MSELISVPVCRAVYSSDKACNCFCCSGVAIVKGCWVTSILVYADSNGWPFLDFVTAGKIGKRVDVGKEATGTSGERLDLDGLSRSLFRVFQLHIY